MAQTNIDICNRALTLIGAPTITSFDDGSREAEVCEQLYDHTYSALLAETNWNFATEDQQLAQSSTTPTDTTWNYQYLLPSAYVNLVCFYTSGGTIIQDYRKQGDHVLCNYNTVFVKFIAKPAENELPAWFERYLVYRLAHDFQEPVMIGGTTQDRLLVQVSDVRLQAYKQDALENPRKDVLAPSRYVRARFM